MPDFHNTLGLLHSEMGTVLSSTIFRLVVAAILGGLIGLERQLRHKPAGLRTNLFICFGAAMYTILSAQLAGSFGGDHTRVAAQIIPGIGFIGAGSILHARG
jgi:putative Mg2+ transporter-C (MgtC) family protein